MRIAIFTDTYYPDINGVVSSIGILRNELMKHGHQVLIITTIPPLGVHMEDDPFIIRMNGISLKSIYGCLHLIWMCWCFIICSYGLLKFSWCSHSNVFP